LPANRKNEVVKTLGFKIAKQSNKGSAMPDDEKLKPEDFPVHTEQKKIVKNDGKTIAEATDKKVAEDVAERLNAEEDRREEDRWSP
jgi:hypothetical protein